MNKDNHLIFEAYKSFRTFVNEQGAEDVNKAAGEVKKAADKLDKAVQAASTAADSTTTDKAEGKSADQSQEPEGRVTIGGIPVGGEPQGQVTVGGVPVGGNNTAPASTPATPETPKAPTPTATPTAPVTPDTSRYLPKTAQQMYQQNKQTPTNTDVTLRPGEPAAPAATTPTPPAPTLDQRMAAADTQGAAAAQTVAQKAEEEKLRLDALEREKQLLSKAAPAGPTPTISAPRTTPVVQTTKGARLDTRRVA